MIRLEKIGLELIRLEILNINAKLYAKLLIFLFERQKRR